MKQAEIDDGARPGTTSQDAARIAELEREVEGAAAGERDPEVRVGFLRGGARPSTALKVAYIDQHKEEFGVQPICDVLKGTDAEIAPSTYYAAKTRPAVGPRRARRGADRGDHA